MAQSQDFRAKVAGARPERNIPDFARIFSNIAAIEESMISNTSILGMLLFPFRPSLPLDWWLENRKVMEHFKAGKKLLHVERKGSGIKDTDYIVNPVSN